MVSKNPPAPSVPEQMSATVHTVAIAVRLVGLRGIVASQILRNSGVTEAMLTQPTELITQAQELTVFGVALQMSGRHRVDSGYNGGIFPTTGRSSANDQ